MAKYTIEINELITRHFDFNLHNYPIFDENYREVLNRKILNHYYFREIGQETPDRFNFMLGTKMDEIMPYYNQLYMSTLIEYDPLASSYFQEIRNAHRDENTKSKRENSHAIIENVGDVTTNITENSSNQTYEQTGTGNENGTDIETINSTSTTTNDLTTKVSSTTDGTGENDTRGTKTTIFSDTPQTPIEENITYNADGSITYNSKSYATTITNENTSQHDETTTHEEGESTSTNTGTVKVDGESTRNLTHNLDTNSTDNRNISNEETQKSTEQKNIARNENYADNTKDNKYLKEKMKESAFYKGRQGFSPADLIQKYRNVLINVDLQVINELETLFMGVF